jgi:class 3 adenylate cyclase/predicted negative regulator of RcsB-dependent stress response
MSEPGTAYPEMESGRDAAARRAWPRAYEALSSTDAAGDLAPEDLELLAKAAWWTGRPNESIDARERAYALYVRRGDAQRAAFTALTLRRELTTQREGSLAAGWLQRAEQLLEGETESVAHGYLAIAHGQLAWRRGELDHALSHMDGAVDISMRVGDRDLKAFAAMYRGMILIDRGQVEDGWAPLEDVSAAAVGGELGAYTTGVVFCNVISTCRDLADYRRATEWADAATRWCERQSIRGFPGVCRVHRAEIMRLVGSWTEAASELERACEELSTFTPQHAAAAFHELGEVRLRMGDLASAEEAFRQADEMGEDPQPGRAMLLLRRGKFEAAASSIRRSLDDAELQLERARLLPIQAEIAFETGDPTTALAAAEELDAIANAFKTEAIRAAAGWARGLANLAGGQPAAAVRALRKTRQRWREVDAPYESARSSAMLAEALVADGDPEAAILELESARSAFERLGANPDALRAAERLEALRRSPTERTVARRTFMFTDIVGSTSLLEAIGDDAWNDLRRWHDETLRGLVAVTGGEEVDHTGDGFFVSFGDAASAVSCAREIQKRLAEHRRDHGFAPQVRIGLHAAEATRAGSNYMGMGVHTAARVGAVAEGGEIVASVTSVEGLEGLDLSDRRSVALKGIAEPVEIVSIDWR